MASSEVTTEAQHIIDQLIASLQNECIEWAPIEQPDDYDHGLFDAVSENALAQQTLEEAISAIESLVGLQIPEPLADVHRRLLFANAIGALETFLSDTFINRVFADDRLLQAYIDTEPKFKERKVPFKDILRQAATVTEEARKELLDVVWHNIAKVKPMFAAVLGIDLGDLSDIAAAIQIRHDIVHRNGRKKDGTIVHVGASAIESLLSEIRKIAVRVELALNLLPPVAVDFEGHPFEI
jgi:hypothetical protein